MRRAWLGALALAAVVGLAGCAENTTHIEETHDTRTQTTNEVNGCNIQSQGSSIIPGNPLSVTTNADHTPAQVVASFEAGPYAGDVDLILEHNGTVEWEFSTPIVVEYGGITHDGITANDTKDWTFTASTETGGGSVDINLEIRWGDGCE